MFKSKGLISSVGISAILVVMMLLWGTHNINTYKNEIINNKLNVLKAEAKNASLSINMMINEHLQVFINVSKDKCTKSAYNVGKSINDISDSFLSTTLISHKNEINNIMLIDSQGTIFKKYSLINNSIFIDRNKLKTQNPKGYKYVNKYNKPFFSTPKFNKSNKQEMVFFFPVSNIQGEIGFTLNIADILRRILDPLNKTKYQSVSLISENGNFIYVPNKTQNYSSISQYLKFANKYKNINKQLLIKTFDRQISADTGNVILHYLTNSVNPELVALAFVPLKIGNQIFSLALAYNYKALLIDANKYSRKVWTIIVTIILIFLWILIILVVSYRKRNNLENEKILLKKLADKSLDLEKRKNEYYSLYEEYKTINEELNKKNLLVEESNEKYRNIFELGSIPIIIRSKEKIIMANNAAVKFFEAGNSENLIGKTNKDIMHPDFSELAKKRIAYVLDEKEKAEVIEAKFITLKGNEKTAKVHGVPFSINNENYVQVILNDITEKVKSANKLQEVSKKLAMHVEQTPFGIIEWDLNFNVQSWNKAAEKIFGFQLNEAIGKHASFIVPEEYKNFVYKVWDELILLKVSNKSKNKNITKNREIIICEW
ncbi:MAG: PAS domain S-box protein, partial [Chlorobi bacterium]|nr:PAS domain S-box protein [Chlorobiota bacterium]